jgi:hypothetical protein
MDAAAGATPRSLGAYVIFDSNNAGLEQRLKALAEKEGLQRVNLCIGAPPPDYEVSKDADVTVVIYSDGQRREQHVTANFALRKGELDEAKTNAIVRALTNVLPATPRVVIATSREKAQTWSYTLDKPADGWFKADFDDRPWKSGPSRLPFCRRP